LGRFCAGGSRGKQYYLVPEQYSHEMERRLSQVGGAATSLYGEVLSFTRLASRVFAQWGGLNIPVLDGGGRMLLMHRAVKSVESQLTVYRRPSRRAAFLEGLLSTADELKSYCVKPEQVVEAGTDSGGQEGNKLHDLGLILSAYDALTAQRAADPRDKLTRLAEGLRESKFLSGCDVYADCFVDFTPQEQLVLKEILRQSHSLTIALTCDEMDTQQVQTEFEPVHRTIANLVRLAKEAGSQVEVCHLDGNRKGACPELTWLESAFYGEAEPWEEETEAVERYTGETPFDQVEYAAGRILELVREKGWRWREIGVTVRSLSSWEDEIEGVFRRYGIPVFLNRMTDILQKPVLSLITSALDAVSQGFEYDDVFRYLKTGLTGITPEQRDKLENYVLRWDIRGTKWTTETPWSWHPEGYAQKWNDSSTALVAELDELRRQVISPLLHLKKAPGETGAQRAMALYQFMEEIGLRQRLEERAQTLTERGDLNRAEEYSQLWEILCGALEQCAHLLEEEKLELAEFSQLFQLVLSQYDVGSIPVSLDRVTVGDAPRMAHKHLKCLFILGAEDTDFPKNGESAGLLSDDDRTLLAEYGLSLAPSAVDRLEREMTIVYELVSLPTEKLVVCRSQRGSTGEEQRPSFLVSRLEALFPKGIVVRDWEKRTAHRLSAPVPALEYLAETRDPQVMAALKALPETAQAAQRLERSFDTKRGRLTHQGVEALYTDTIRLSASKMDKIRGCHFSYFMQYGLKAKARKPAGFSAPEAGTFVHYVLEFVLKKAKEKGGVANCTDEEIKKLIRQSVNNYIRFELGGVEDKPRRFQYLFRRLVKSVDQVVHNVVDELRHSQFQPIDFELGFGQGSQVPVQVQCGELTLSITGFVDRVDGWYHDGRLYYRVVDYKTGKKSFDFTEVWNGLGLQMLIYLFALQEKGEYTLGTQDPIPAGVLYLPAREVIVDADRDIDDDLRQKQVDKDLVRTGLLLKDEQVLQAMEQAGENGIRFLPIKVKKGGELSDENLATAAQLGRLKKHIERILNEIGRDFATGNVDADPYFQGEKSACEYCDYASACHFEEGESGNCRRYLSSVKAKEFWDKVEAETEEKEGGK
jgi:ATP-dependent helicase/nuclease subunit B